jgi:predicted GNAT superfamily acetyltransferase
VRGCRRDRTAHPGEQLPHRRDTQPGPSLPDRRCRRHCPCHPPSLFGQPRSQQPNDLLVALTREQAHRQDEVDDHSRRQQPAPLLDAPRASQHIVDKGLRKRARQHPDRHAIRQTLIRHLDLTRARHITTNDRYAPKLPVLRLAITAYTDTMTSAVPTVVESSASMLVDSERCAHRTAARSALTVLELSDVVAQHEAAALLTHVWRAEPDLLVSPALLRAFQYSGGYVAGAYQGGRMVGAAVGFLGAGHLHSDLLGVQPDLQGSGVGHALKLHQRAWALHHGLAEICWTFDPLMRRNAYFNLRKLAATAAGYMPDFYGRLDDGVNSGDATDRIYVRWRLDSPQVAAAARGDVALVERAFDDARALLDEADNQPVTGRVLGGPTLTVALPADIEKLRARDPKLAARWRCAVRDVLIDALAAGYAISGMSAERGYVLTRRTDQEVGC